LLFQQAAARVLLEARAMDFQSVDDEVIPNSIPLISRHNINASNALYLHQALNLQHLLQLMEHELVLVAADRRLLRAAENEVVIVLNPEEAEVVDVEGLLRPEDEEPGELEDVDR